MGRNMADVNILLVEDDAVEALDLKRTLESYGYTVPYMASRCEEAVTKSLELMPDLVLVDIILKGEKSGIDVASEISNLNIPVIYITAHSEESTVQKARLTRPYGYLVKPFNRIELKFAIEFALYKSNQEKKLRESEENFRAIAENANEGVIIASEKGKHVYANQMAAEISGYTIEELLKTTMADLAHPDEFNKHIDRHKTFIEGGTVSPSFETRLVRKDGDIVPVEFTAAKTIWKGKPAALALFHNISDRKKTENALKESRQQFKTVADFTYDWEYWIGPDGNYVYISPSCERITGYTIDEFLNDPNLMLKITHPDDLDKIKVHIENELTTKQLISFEYRIINKDGNERWIAHICQPIYDDSGLFLGRRASNRDITEQKKAEDEQKRLNRQLRAISSCNKAMLRAVDEQTLINEVCRIICNESGYRLAWVGYAEHDIAKTIRPIAWAGYDSGYIASAKLSWSEDDERGQGPAGLVIRRGELVYVQDFKTDSLMTPWRESALEHGYRSGIALPLKDKKGKTFGVLLIYSAEPNAINSDEIELMEALSEDLSFGIISLREHEDLKKAEKKLKKASLYNRSLIEASLDPLVTIGPDGRITDVNNATEIATGCSRDEIIGTDFSDYFTDPVKAKKGYKQVFREGFVQDYPLEIKNKDGGITSVLYNASVYKDESDEVVGVFAAARDISDRIEMEDRLKESEERMSLTLEAAQIGLWDWDVKNDKWFASPTYYTMLGYESRPGPGDRAEWMERVHPDDQTMVKERIQKVLIQNFDSYEYEARMRHADGKYRWVSVAGFSIARDLDGNATRISGIRMDITKRKKAEEKLKLASLYNRSLIEASVDPLVTIGPDGRITDVNHATETVTGYPRTKIVGTDFSDYFTESEKARKGYKKVFKDGFVQDYPLEIKNKDGHVTPVLYNASVYKNESGEVVGVFAAARDITERKKAEEKIQMLANVVESSDDAIISKSLEGCITSWNKGAESIYGYSQEEVLGKDISILAPHKLKNEVKSLIEKVKLGEHITHYETIRVRKDGEVINVSLTLSPFNDSSGNLAGISTIARDITERKIAEDAVIREKKEWESTFDAVPDLIAILDTNYHVIRANKAMANRLGVNPLEVIGVTCFEVVHGLKEPPIFCPHRKLLEDSHEHTAEVHEDRIGGDFIVSVSPLFDSKGKLMGSVHVARDITDRKKAEDQVKKSLKEKEVLLKEIHHRVKNNLQIISSLLDLQEAYVKEDPIAVNVLRESQNRVKAMAAVYEKLYLSKDLNKINFYNYIQSLLQGLFYSDLRKEGQIGQIVEVEDIMLNIETAVPCGLIISELVSNSLKHAFPEGRKGLIHVSLKALKDKYELRISDDGIGFPENINFKKTDTLGLKLVNNLVKQLEGKINMSRNHGTEFKIIFKELLYKKRIDPTIKNG